MDVTVAGVAVDGVAVVGVDDDYEQFVFFFLWRKCYQLLRRQLGMPEKGKPRGEPKQW